jgi:putative endonuclease
VTAHRQRLGAEGEAAVAAHFEALGYRVEARNWRCDVGELDLVVSRGDLLVFVEVRTVASDFLETPVLTVGPGKQRRVARAADAFLRACAFSRSPEIIRFDVVGVRAAEGVPPQLEHIENAFVPSWAF